MMNWSHRQIVFVPGCMLCPAYQAVHAEKNMLWQQQIITYLVSRHIGIIQMPCPEASFQSYEKGKTRGAHGVGYYEKLPGFCEHCAALGKNVVGQVMELTQAGYTVVAVIGIEHSPTCAASYMYTNHGMEKRKGIYMSVIHEGFRQNELDIPVMGINRRFPGKFVRDISRLCE